MSNQSETLSDLRLHVDDLKDILASISLDDSARAESVWYEYWDCVLNYWIRRSSDHYTRLSVAPQRQLVREILSDRSEADECADWSFEADSGDTSIDLGDTPPSIQERIRDSRDGVATESRTPDFVAFALRRQGIAHRRLVCLIEIKPHIDKPRTRLSAVSRQMISQAKFAFDSFPYLLHVFSILAFGDSSCLFRFPRDEVTQMYLEHVAGDEDCDTFDPTRASKRSNTIDIGLFVVIPFYKVLKSNGSSYNAHFEKAIGLITADLKAMLDSLGFRRKY